MSIKGLIKKILVRNRKISNETIEYENTSLGQLSISIAYSNHNIHNKSNSICIFKIQYEEYTDALDEELKSLNSYAYGNYDIYIYHRSKTTYIISNIINYENLIQYAYSNYKENTLLKMIYSKLHIFPRYLFNKINNITNEKFLDSYYEKSAIFETALSENKFL